MAEKGNWEKFSFFDRVFVGTYWHIKPMYVVMFTGMILLKSFEGCHLAVKGNWKKFLFFDHVFVDKLAH